MELCFNCLPLLFIDLDSLPSECGEKEVLSTKEIVFVGVASSVVVIVIVIGVVVAVIAIYYRNKKHKEEIQKIEEQHSMNRRQVIREARKDVLGILEILPAIQDNSEIMDIIKRDLEDMKGGIMADEGESNIAAEGAINADEGEGNSFAKAIYHECDK